MKKGHTYQDNNLKRRLSWIRSACLLGARGIRPVHSPATESGKKQTPSSLKPRPTPGESSETVRAETSGIGQAPGTRGAGNEMGRGDRAKRGWDLDCCAGLDLSSPKESAKAARRSACLVQLDQGCDTDKCRAQKRSGKTPPPCGPSPAYRRARLDGLLTAMASADWYR